MAEQTFLSPGFFETEIDLTKRVQEVTGVPGGIIGFTDKGPAFVPVTVGSFTDFQNKFGDLDDDKPGTYAAYEFLKNKTALTFVRVLGAGGNATLTDISATKAQGTVKNAGFKLTPAQITYATNDRRHVGAVHFIAAKHVVTANETVGYPVFSDNVSFNVGASPGSDTALMVRAMVMVPSGTRLQILDHNQSYSPSNALDDTAAIGASTLANGMDGKFKLVISSSAPGFDTAEGKTGIRIYTASLNPRSSDYIYNILNTDPNSFQKEQHLLYAHFPVEPEIADVTATGQAVAIMSGSSRTSAVSGDTAQTFLNAFGKFDTRYKAARTTNFISQPFGNTEHDLFYFEALDDGAFGNTQVKVSISNIRKSEDPNNPYGTFDVLVRRFSDTDSNIQVLEQFPQCDLNPQSDRYIGLLVGDRKVYYDFDAENEAERRFIVTGRYANKSSFIRVIASEGVINRTVPAASLPFGFRGIPVLKTNDTMTDSATEIPGIGAPGSAGTERFGVAKNDPSSDPDFQYSILPPVPFRFKVTRGSVASTGNYTGEIGVNETVDANLFWGVKFEAAPNSTIVAAAALDSNAGSDQNLLISSYARLLGIQQLDTLVTGSGADTFSNNKFTLARVALLNSPVGTSIVSALTGTADEHMLGAAYIRNGTPASSNYTIEDPQSAGYNRITLASVLALTSSVYFNRFSNYAKFTNFLYGGFDGVNILDRDMAILNDRSTSADSGGKALSTIDIGIANPAGTGLTNNGVASYNAAVDIITNPLTSRINILAIPGIRDSLITDYAMEGVKNYGQAAFILDLAPYTEDTIRVFAKDGSRPDVQTTSDQFSSRAIDNNYAATYFPDVTQADPLTGRRVNLPASVAALAGISYSDRVAYPWYAPAGFNRGALSAVSNTQVRLNSADRDTLYVARINPIARLPDVGYVIFGQKTLQVAKSALDRLNVRRMLLEVKRIVGDIAMTIVFEQNTPATRARFVDAVTPQLAIIQAQQGIEAFRVVMDGTNNTEADIEANRLNGRIVLVPTRAVEFIAIDFVITNAGVSFE
jgi:hypothetical protein